MEPIGPDHVGDLLRLHQDEVVAKWYGGSWSEREAEGFAGRCAEGWQHGGVGKWMAYDRQNGELIGRGGLSRLPAGRSQARQIGALVDRSWSPQRLELGWAILSIRQGHGYATEIGREGLRYAAGQLGANLVIAFTEMHNVRSRAVMERLAMRFAGTILTIGLVEGRTTISARAPFAVYASKLAAAPDPDN